MSYLKSKLNFSLALAGAACCLAAASPAKALTITADDQGWYDNFNNHFITNLNYIVGDNGFGIRRNFFVFSLPSSPIISASFTVPT
jgi:hypothetical protein